MAQTVETWFGNSSVRRGALKDALPYEDQPDETDLDHPSAYIELTGGSQRRNIYRLPAVPVRHPDHAYTCGVNGVEDEMIALLDGEGGDEIVWNPRAIDLTKQAQDERLGKVEVKKSPSEAWAAIEKDLAVLVGYANGEPIIRMKPAPKKPTPRRRQPQRIQPMKAAAKRQPKPTGRKATIKAVPVQASPAEPACPLEWGGLVLPDLIHQN
jgi:hypothetical protein